MIHAAAPCENADGMNRSKNAIVVLTVKTKVAARRSVRGARDTSSFSPSYLPCESAEISGRNLQYDLRIFVCIVISTAPAAVAPAPRSSLWVMTSRRQKAADMSGSGAEPDEAGGSPDSAARASGLEGDPPGPGHSADAASSGPPGRGEQQGFRRAIRPRVPRARPLGGCRRSYPWEDKFPSVGNPGPGLSNPRPPTAP